MLSRAIMHWEKLTKREKHFYTLYGNGFKQIEIASLEHISCCTVRSHLHRGKRKAKCDTIEEALSHFSTAQHIPKLHPDEKKRYKIAIEKNIAKFGKPKP
jgi:DNA-binding CsgD family transcriptional regulator